MNFQDGLERELASDFFTPLSFDPDSKLFYLSDRNMGFGFICDPLNGVNQSVIDKVNVLLSYAFPAGTLIQFNLFASPDIQAFIDRMLTTRSSAETQIVQDITNNKAEFLESGTYVPMNSRVKNLVRNFVLMVTVKIPFKGGGDFPTDQEMISLSECRVFTKQTLDSMQMINEDLVPESYIRYMASIFNWQPDATWRDAVHWDQSKLIRDQILDFSTSITNKEQNLKLGNKHVKVLSPKRYPDETSVTNMFLMIGEPRTGSRGIFGNFMITTNVYFPEQGKTRDELTKKKMMTDYQAFGPVVKFSPQITVRKNGYDALFKEVDKGDKILSVQQTFSIFSDSVNDANEQAGMMISYYRELGYQMNEDKFIHLPLFLNSLPFLSPNDQKTVSFFRRYSTLASSQASHMLPILSEWKGTGYKPILTLTSRFGQPMSIDLFDSQTNFNTCIVAASGSGKSFLTNEIITSYLSIGAKIWVVDVGRSYKKLCSVIGGDFVEFTKESQLCLNPFQLVKSYEDEGDMLVGIIAAMSSPSEKLSDFQTAKLREVVKLCWDEHDRNLTIDIIADALLQFDDSRISDIGAQLYAFTSKGEYGQWFIGENNMDFSNDFTVLELEELKPRPHLMQIVLLMLIYQVQQNMYLGSRERKKILILDEAWDLLTSGGDITKFIVTAYRLFRKYNGAAICITQSLSDLYDNPRATPIAENSANLFFLNQKAEVIEQIKRSGKLEIGDWGFDTLKSVHTQRGFYSEIFFYTNVGMGVGRLIVNRFTQILYSTHPDDINAVERRVKTGMTIAEAIEDVVRQEEQSLAA